jgi:hypothetical protein
MQTCRYSQPIPRSRRGWSPWIWCPTPDAAQLLDVEVHQFPRPRPLVAHHGDRRREGAQPGQPEPPLGDHHRRDREAQVGRDPQRAPALGAELGNPPPQRPGEAPRRAVRPAGAIGEARSPSCQRRSHLYTVRRLTPSP